MFGEDCPAWCSGGHSTAENEPMSSEDAQQAVHATQHPPIPVVSLVRHGDGSLTIDAEMMDIVLFQYQHSRQERGEAEEEWVFIGSNENAVTVTRESAGRLYRLLGRVLAAGT